MGLSTADEYRESLRDGRTLWYQGRRIPDILAEPDLRVAVDHAALDYAVGHDPRYRDLAVAEDPASGAEFSAFYAIPRCSDDLLRRSRLIETVTGLGGTMVTLVKEIGSDALFGLLRVLEGEKRERVLAFYEHCRDGDLSVAVAQTDVKGDRSLPPHAQADPDLYVHVVEERSDGIVVRGAKCHTSIAANAHEIVVLPTRAMGPDDADYAVAFAVPVDTPGLSLYVSAYGAREHDAFEFPISSKHKMLETLTVFDDVFVPVGAGVPLPGARTRRAGCTRVRRVPSVHRGVVQAAAARRAGGTAALITEMNGVSAAGHIREKLTQLVIYAETVRALTEMAGIRAEVGQHGIASPDPLTTNLAKYTFATGYHAALELVQDCAGGLLVTGPGGADWANPEVRAVLEKFYAAKAPAEDRLRLLNMISDLTARDFGGYHAVLAVHAEGSIEAEKMQIFRAYEPGKAIASARRLAGLD